MLIPTVPDVGADKPKHSGGNLKWFVLGILVCILALFFFHTSAQSPDSNPLRAVAQLTAMPRTMPLVNTALSVDALHTAYDKFTVPANATAVSVEGHFTAAGGMGNDIEVFLMSEDNFVNFQNGHSVETFYNSGKVTQDTFNVTLPSGGGTYYLVFSNKFSLLSAKAVQVASTLHYTI